MTSENESDPDRRPASQRIADHLRSAIESGELAPGDKIPSERQLAAEHSTARNTARAAIDLLAAEGLVLVRQGAASIVRPSLVLIRLGNDRYSHKYRDTGLSPFLIECQKQGKTGRFEVLSIEQIQPPAEVANRLDVDPDSDSVIRRENVFWADEDPVQRVTTYIPWRIAEGTGLVEEVVPHQYGIHGVFEDQGYVMARIREEITARMPNPDERTRLQVPQGVPVIEVLHTSVDEQGRPYEVTRFVLRADMNGLTYDTPVE